MEEVCEVCNEELVVINSYPKTIGYHNCPKRQAPEFYVEFDGSIVVWEEDGNPFHVRVVGEMQIYATYDNGERITIRDAEELIRFGITNDEELRGWANKGDEVFYYRLNPWFEVHHDKDGDYFSDAFFELNDAIEWAKYAHENPEEIEVNVTKEDKN